jgi:hypothetical protein
MGDLQKFLTDISSIYWWVSVFIVGLLVSVAGEFISKLIDKTTSKSFEAFRKKSKQWRTKSYEERMEIIEMLTENHDRFVWFQMRTETLLITGFLYLIFSAVFLILTETGSIMPYYLKFIFELFSIIVMFLGARRVFRWKNRTFIIREIIEKQIEETEDKLDVPTPGGGEEKQSS